MSKRLLLLPLLVLACSKTATTATPTPSASIDTTAKGDASVAVTPSSSAAADPMAKLPPAKTLPTAPITVVGYPKTVGTGMNDPADWVGFTTDGSEYGYCATLGARDQPQTNCVTTLRDGSSKKRSTDDAKNNYSNALAKDLTDWQKSSGLTKLAFGKAGFDKWFAKPLKGSWAFSDLVIWVNPVAGDGTKVNAVVKLGGAVDGEPPVYPVSLAAKPIAQGTTYHTSWANDLSLSPDGTEIGLVGGFFCMEWCDDFVVYRNGTAAFASLVYNDTGYRHHQKAEFARAAELFLAATWADKNAKLPPYNLACAWARLGDERAKDALAVAIARDPSAKARAKTDADFAGVKDAAWFRALTD